MRRIVVVGASGSGKTTLGRELARRLALPFVELDALSWEPGWVTAPPDLLRARADEALAGAAWVVDGNYRALRDIVWGRADTVVWLDYRLARIYWQLTRRTIADLVTRRELWPGCRERLGLRLVDSRSMFNWARKQQVSHRDEYPRLVQEPPYADLRLIRLRSPRETGAWLAGVSTPPVPP